MDNYIIEREAQKIKTQNIYFIYVNPLNNYQVIRKISQYLDEVQIFVPEFDDTICIKSKSSKNYYFLKVEIQIMQLKTNPINDHMKLMATFLLTNFINNSDEDLLTEIMSIINTDFN